MSDHIWGNMPPTPLSQMVVNRQFQDKTATYKNRNISKTVNRIKPKLRTKLRPTLHFVGGLTLPTSNPILLPAIQPI